MTSCIVFMAIMLIGSLVFCEAFSFAVYKEVQKEQEESEAELMGFIEEELLRLFAEK